MIHVIDPGYPGWMWLIGGLFIAAGIFLFAVGLSVGDYEGGDHFAVAGAIVAILVAAITAGLTLTAYQDDYDANIVQALTLEGYSNVSYDGESTFTAASPTGEYFSGYLAPLGDDTFKIVEIPS